MRTGDGALRFTLARAVNLVAVSSGPRPSGPDELPAHVRLVDLATAGELAELVAAHEAPADTDVTSPPLPSRSPSPDPGALDGLVARAEARLFRARSDRCHDS